MLISPKLSAEPRASVPYYIYNAATAFQLDSVLMYSICQVESNCQPKAFNPHDSNAQQRSRGIVDKSYGLFQIKLSTAKSLGFDKHAKELLKPEVNAWYAAKLLRSLYSRYGETPKVLSAYNAGRPSKCNRGYVSKVLKYYARYKIDQRF